MTLPANVAYWRRGEPIANFGDYLTELLYAGLFHGPTKYPQARIHLLGSVIARDWFKQAAEHGFRRVVFWGCGLRRPKLLSRAAFRRAVLLGVRGPLSRDWLDLPAATPLGDPALILPRIYMPRTDAAVAGRTICMPHFLDDTGEDTLLAGTGADLVLRPNIQANLADCERLIDALASARFVLAGALHGAIVAHAYGVPFAFYRAPSIDIPFKWQDFAASIGFDCAFVDTVAEGEAFYDANRGRASQCSVDGLLDVAPFPLRAGLR
jgi:hypothetical protein